MINMSTNSYKSRRRAQARFTFIVILALIYLIGVTSYNAFILAPKQNHRVEQVMTSFGEFKTYIDAKLPEMDSALIRHENQIAEQNKQLEELNTLTRVLKEENEE